MTPTTRTRPATKMSEVRIYHHVLSSWFRVPLVLHLSRLPKSSSNSSRSIARSNNFSITLHIMDAGKQAHIYIVDQGSTTAECHSGRTESDLDWSLKYVYDKLGTVLAANRTTLGVGVLGLRTDETNNSLAVDEDGDANESYQNITVHKELGPFGLSDLESVREKLTPSQTEAGDAISAIVVAIEMINKFTMLKTGKPGKYGRKIVLVTDGQGYIDNTDQSNLDSIASRLNELEIELIVLGIDFDDLEVGFKEEDKSEQKVCPCVQRVLPC